MNVSAAAILAGMEKAAAIRLSDEIRPGVLALRQAAQLAAKAKADGFEQVSHGDPGGWYRHVRSLLSKNAPARQVDEALAAGLQAAPLNIRFGKAKQVARSMYSPAEQPTAAASFPETYHAGGTRGSVIGRAVPPPKVERFSGPIRFGRKGTGRQARTMDGSFVPPMNPSAAPDTHGAAAKVMNYGRSHPLKTVGLAVGGAAALAGMAYGIHRGLGRGTGEQFHGQYPVREEEDERVSSGY